jgi:hypothetical protein
MKKKRIVIGVLAGLALALTTLLGWQGAVATFQSSVLPTPTEPEPTSTGFVTAEAPTSTPEATGAWYDSCPSPGDCEPTNTPQPTQEALPTLTPRPTLTPIPIPTCRPVTCPLDPPIQPTQVPHPTAEPYPTQLPYPTQPTWDET